MPLAAPPSLDVAIADVPRTPALADLTLALRNDGAFRARPRYYAALAGGLVLATGAIAAATAVVGASAAPWWAALLAVPAAVVSAQFGFLGHDAGHRHIARSKRWNRRVGLLSGNLASGLSFGWWQDKHRRHHQQPNRVGVDPDVGDGVIAWTAEQQRTASGVGGVIARHQAALFPALLTLEGWQLAWSSVRSLRERPAAERRTEAALLVAHAAVHLSFLFTVLPPAVAVTFVLLHRAVYGLLLGAAFAPNHIGMPMPTAELDPLRRQVVTSRNVAGSRWLDLAFGGLNFQIEHHLYPGIPRPNLRDAAPLVREHCAAAGVPYHRVPLRTAYREIHAALDRPPSP